MDLVDATVVTVIWSFGIASAFLVAVDALRVRLGVAAALWIVLTVAFWPVGAALYYLARRRHVAQKQAFAAVDGRAFDVVPRADVLRSDGRRLYTSTALMLGGLVLLAYANLVTIGGVLAAVGLLMMLGLRRSGR